MHNTEEFNRRVEDCREIYLRYGGRDHEKIELEMRELGYRDFHRRKLYRRFERGRCKPGWIETYGWDSLLRNEEKREAEENLPQINTEETDKNSASDPPDLLRPALKNHSSNDRVHQQPDFNQPEFPAETQRRGDEENLPQINTDETDKEKNNSSDPRNPCISVAKPSSPRLGVSAVEYVRPPAAAGGSDVAFANFLAWLKRVSPNMKWEWKHQVYIYKYLERVTKGECKRLMIFLPPRHGKSELVTVRYAAWRLKQDPSI